MNWITLAVVGAVAAWFEYNYQRSKRRRREPAAPPSVSPIAEATSVEITGEGPSIVSGDQNDKEMNTAV
jgi:hypothetical protein